MSQYSRVSPLCVQYRWCFKFMYTTAACLPHAPRPGKVWTGVCWHGLGRSLKLSCSPHGPVFQGIRACLVHRPCMSTFYRCCMKLTRTTGDKLAYTACARSKRVSPGGLARLGSTVASIKALDHANTRLLILCPHEVRTVNKRRWCI